MTGEKNILTVEMTSALKKGKQPTEQGGAVEYVRIGSGYVLIKCRKANDAAVAEGAKNPGCFP